MLSRESRNDYKKVAVHASRGSLRRWAVDKNPPHAVFPRTARACGFKVSAAAGSSTLKAAADENDGANKAMYVLWNLKWTLLWKYEREQAAAAAGPCTQSTKIPCIL